MGEKIKGLEVWRGGYVKKVWRERYCERTILTYPSLAPRDRSSHSVLSCCSSTRGGHVPELLPVMTATLPARGLSVAADIVRERNMRKMARRNIYFDRISWGKSSFLFSRRTTRATGRSPPFTTLKGTSRPFQTSQSSIGKPRYYALCHRRRFPRLRPCPRLTLPLLSLLRSDAPTDKPSHRGYGSFHCVLGMPAGSRPAGFGAPLAKLSR